jgi:modified peptide precursor CbpA
MKKQTQNKKAQKDVIATRKACKADGTGLSHYILMDKKAK